MNWGAIWGAFGMFPPQSLAIIQRSFSRIMTNAWIQRFLTIGSLLLAAVLGAWLWDEHRALAWAALSFPIWLMAMILGLQCMLAAWLNRADPAPSASLWQWIKAWLAEWRVAALTIHWRQPFTHAAIADQTAEKPGQRGMVLVHGFFCNRAFWTHWMDRLQREGRSFVSVDLEPAYGSINDYAAIVERAVAQVEKATGMPPVIVGHSMGGLAIRAWAATQTAQDIERRVQRVFTLGTPHHGTALAGASYTHNGHQMKRMSQWLAANLSKLPDSFVQKCTCYYSNCDNIVFPASTATLPGADNRHIAGFAHIELAFSHEIEQASWATLNT
jgi:triacylglycerol lipase